LAAAERRVEARLSGSPARFAAHYQEKVVKTNQTPPAVLDFGRYALHDAIASGGMATVHLGRMGTTAGVTRTVAIKRMHPHLLAEPDFASMFLDEARLAMRIQHPNVVGTFDVIATETELLLVMDFVLGESLDRLLRRARATRQPPPVRVICSVLAGVLTGLHAAHEARDEGGAPLDIVHRDVSPQNVLVGVDGVPRVVDFGVAKAAGRLHTTEEGQIKGKLAYMAPEQLTMARLDRRVDVFAAAAVLWEPTTRAPPSPTCSTRRSHHRAPTTPKSRRPSTRSSCAASHATPTCASPRRARWPRRSSRRAHRRPPARSANGCSARRGNL
jgi:serine/threonine protein kinase